MYLNKISTGFKERLVLNIQKNGFPKIIRISIVVPGIFLFISMFIMVLKMVKNFICMQNIMKRDLTKFVLWLKIIFFFIFLNSLK